MRKLLPAILASSTLTLAVALGAPALAAGPDPSVDQIYQAVQAGHIDQAQTMIEEVLRDHPESWKAHFVQAELFAKEGKTAQARSELARAEEIQPGLPRENPHSVDELKSQLGLTARTSAAPHYNGMTTVPTAERHFPVWTVVVLVGAVILLWMLFRRRPVAYPMGAVPAGGAPGYGPGYGGPMGPGGYGGPVGGGGIGSGIAGGLASGLAVGAGVVAGEELAHHFLDGGQREGTVLPPASENSGWDNSNSDSGGTDFGVNDPGSWDDGSSGGGGDSGGDWS